jgi:hypothetical protein
MTQLILPEFNPLDPLQYIVDIDNLQKKIEEPKKRHILKFINSWMGKKNDEKYKSFNCFINIYLKQFPSDNITKKFLCKYFEVYNQDFKLDLVYNENLFTTFNALYMLKLMLNTINHDLKKDVIKIKLNNGEIKKTKIYSIIYKKR